MKLFIALLLAPSVCLGEWLEPHLRRVEVLHLETYRDTRRHTAIGYGHQNTGKGQIGCTRRQAEKWLRSDIREARHIVRLAVTRQMTPGQYDALTSLAFNIGKGHFERSTLLKRFNGGDTAGAAWEFTRWVRSDRHVRPWLRQRRALELKRYWGKTL